MELINIRFVQQVNAIPLRVVSSYIIFHQKWGVFSDFLNYQTLEYLFNTKHFVVYYRCTSWSATNEVCSNENPSIYTLINYL
jgi:hypothetical protein